MKGTPLVHTGTGDTKYAYRTFDPAALAAYRTAVAARREYTVRIRAAAAALGGNVGALAGNTSFGGPEKIFGLSPDGSGTVPAGWCIVRRQLEPAKRGPGSAAARRWLEQHQPPPGVDILFVLKDHGLAYQSRVYIGGGSYQVHHPIIIERDDTLFACYLGKPDGDFPEEPAGMTWDELPTAEFWAVKALDDRDRAVAGAATAGLEYESA
jgi:hypothetical protein